MDSMRVKLKGSAYTAYKVDGSEELANYFVTKYNCEKVSDPLHPEVFWVKLPSGRQVLSGSYIVEDGEEIEVYTPSEFHDKYDVVNSSTWRRSLSNNQYT